MVAKKTSELPLRNTALPAGASCTARGTRMTRAHPLSRSSHVGLTPTRVSAQVLCSGRCRARALSPRQGPARTFRGGTAAEGSGKPDAVPYPGPGPPHWYSELYHDDVPGLVGNPFERSGALWGGEGGPGRHGLHAGARRGRVPCRPGAISSRTRCASSMWSCVVAPPTRRICPSAGRMSTAAVLSTGP